MEFSSFGASQLNMIFTIVERNFIRFQFSEMLQNEEFEQVDKKVLELIGGKNPENHHHHHHHQESWPFSPVY